jgi:PEP-CTERM motif
MRLTSRFIRGRVAGALLIGAAVAFAAPAGATPWTESGDAGDLVGTAQVTVGTGALTSIDGAIASYMSDLYLIHIDDPTAFSASTVGGAGFDTQLFLFDSTGVGVYANDDSSGLQSTLPAGNANGPTAVGDYLLGISSWDRDPVNVGGLVFPTTPFSGVLGPNNLDPLTGWSSTGSFNGTYSIALTGTSFAQATSVPEPGTALLMGAGLLGLVLLRRRRTG